MTVLLSGVSYLSSVSATSLSTTTRYAPECCGTSIYTGDYSLRKNARKTEGLFRSLEIHFVGQSMS
jgi:hypothetical protein